MMLNYLEFEQPIAELEAKIDELRNVSRNGDYDLGLEEEINKLKEKSLGLTRKIFAELGAWQVAQLARHPLRPYTLDYIQHMFTDFDDLAGDRTFANDQAIVGGTARLGETALFPESEQEVGDAVGREQEEQAHAAVQVEQPEKLAPHRVDEPIEQAVVQKRQDIHQGLLRQSEGWRLSVDVVGVFDWGLSVPGSNPSRAGSLPQGYQLFTPASCLAKNDGRRRLHIDPRHRARQMSQVLVVLGNDVFRLDIAIVDGGMGICRQYHVVAQFQRLAHGGVDTVIGLQAADDQAFEILDGQQFLQVGLVERIPGGLVHAAILW